MGLTYETKEENDFAFIYSFIYLHMHTESRFYCLNEENRWEIFP